MIDYASPEQTPRCLCRENPMRATLCMTGHMLECHQPFGCSQAACSHLPKYHDEEDARDLEGYVQDARALLRSLAAADCPECQGNVLETVREELAIDLAALGYPGQNLVASRSRICECVHRRLEDRASQETP